MEAQSLFATGGAVGAVPRVADEDATLVGRRIGVYHFLAKLGAGGLGDVYRARDTKVGRDGAIKILPRPFTGDPERIARFAREARILASLNHPNIATIHGVEEAGGLRALVMEPVDGPTLSGRVATGPLPTHDALALATQIAAALEAAHEKGIIHRDLKPANIAITADGRVKVLDFGIAKLAAVDAAGAELTQSPTVTAARTGDGMPLGTAAYMNPEQARGEGVDKRTDIWAFGCVLYEMLTGRAAFAKRTLSDTLAAILQSEPNWSALPAYAGAGSSPARAMPRQGFTAAPSQHLGHAPTRIVEKPTPPPGTYTMPFRGGAANR